MLVIHLIPQLRLGAGRYVAEAAAFQVRSLGHKVEVVVSPDAEGNWRTDSLLADELASSQIPVRVGGDFFHRDLDGILRSAEQISALLPSGAARTVVHAHSAMAAAAARWAGAGCVVVTCHGTGPARPEGYDLQDALAFGLCDAVVTPSEYWAEKLRTVFGVAHPIVIPVGIDVGKYSAIARSRDRSEGRPTRLVTVCELTHRKGVDRLIAAMPRIWQHSEEIELHIFGSGDDETPLHDQASVLDPGGSRIRFRGHVPRSHSPLTDFDIFLLASRSDNQPLAVMEAMLAGLPVVASAVGGIPEMILDSGCGAVVDATSPAILAEAVIDMLGKGRDHLEALGSRGRSFARHRYAIERSMKDLDDVYEGALRRSAGRHSADLHTSIAPTE